jgi:hypothetical protein
VWTRDGGRCQWPVASGGICGSTHRVELDHVIPRARGGPSTVENLRVLCRLHNAVAARHVFGDAWMDRYTRAGAGPGEEAGLPPGDQLWLAPLPVPGPCAPPAVTPSS